MFGFIGTNANAVFKSLAVIFCLFFPTQLQAAVFQSHDIFSRMMVSQDQTNSVSSNLKEFSMDQRILVFINPNCPWCEKSLNNLNSFKKRNPNWVVRVYVMSNVKEFIDFFRMHLENLPSGLEYILDFKNSVANIYGINQTPTYVIISHGGVKKVEGYVDLARFVLDDHA